MIPQFTKNIIDHVLPISNKNQLYLNVLGLLIITVFLGFITFVSTYLYDATSLTTSYNEIEN